MGGTLLFPGNVTLMFLRATTSVCVVLWAFCRQRLCLANVGNSKWEYLGMGMKYHSGNFSANFQTELFSCQSCWAGSWQAWSCWVSACQWDAGTCLRCLEEAEQRDRASHRYLISVRGINTYLLLLNLIFSEFLPFATEMIMILRFLRVLCWNIVGGELAFSLGLVAGSYLFHPGSILDSSLQSPHLNCHLLCYKQLPLWLPFGIRGVYITSIILYLLHDSHISVNGTISYPIALKEPESV